MSRANSQLPFYVVKRVRGLKFWVSIKCQRCHRKWLMPNAFVYEQRGKTLPCPFC